MTNTPVALSSAYRLGRSHERPAGWRRLTRTDRAEMIRVYKAGQSAATVAEQLHVSQSGVLKILKADAVAVRPRGNPGDFNQ
jgi:hypothetical protein